MKEKAKEVTGLKKKISTKGKKVALKCNLEDKESGMFNVFQKILFSKIKMALGLDQCIVFFSGAAPIMAETHNYHKKKCHLFKKGDFINLPISWVLALNQSLINTIPPIKQFSRKPKFLLSGDTLYLAFKDQVILPFEFFSYLLTRE